LEVVGDRWADGAALWYDVATALIPDAGCACDPPAEGSKDYWNAVETAFLSVGAVDDDEAPAPIVFVVRKAGALAPDKENAGVGSGCAHEARTKITRTIDVLYKIYDSLVSDGFSVSIVLEGWPASVPLGDHVAQSLALPRVSRRSGKSKRFNKTRAEGKAREAEV
jgi:hypothetical protein